MTFTATPRHRSPRSVLRRRLGALALAAVLGLSTAITIAPGVQAAPIAEIAATDPVSSVLSSDGATLFIANAALNTVTIVNTAESSTRTVTVPGEPRRIAVTPNGATAFVASGLTGRITRIDTRTASVLGSAASPVTTPWEGELALNSDATALYLTDPRGGSLMSAPVEGETTWSLLSLPQPRTVFSLDATNEVVVAVNNSTALRLFSPTDLPRTLSLGAESKIVLPSPRSATVYAVTPGSREIMVWDTTSLTLRSTITAPHPVAALTISGDGRSLITASTGGIISVLATEGNRATESAVLPDTPAAISSLSASPQADTIYVGSRNSLRVISQAPAAPSTLVVGLGHHSTQKFGGADTRYELISGALPSGVTLDSTGQLYGAAQGESPLSSVLSLRISAPGQLSRLQQVTLKAVAAPVIGAAPVSSIPVASASSVVIPVYFDGDSVVTLSAGALAPGLTLSSTGVISGTVAAKDAGQYHFTLRATASTGQVTEREVSLAATQAPTLTTTHLASGLASHVYSAQILAAGFPSPTLSVSAGTLPPGLDFDPETGYLSGVPTMAGDYTFTFQARSGTLVDERELLLSITESVTITSTAPADAHLGSEYHHRFTASGFPAAGFALTAGTLPEGLELDPHSGVLSGTPTQSGAFALTLTASNSTDSTSSQSFTLRVAETVRFTPATPPRALAGSAFNYRIPVSGFPAPTFSLDTAARGRGALPQGLSLDAATGVISGVPTVAGTTTVTITADNGVDTPVQTALTLQVDEAASITTTVAEAPGGLVGAAYRGFQIDVRGTGPFLFAATGLPAGLQIHSETGLISGTPTAAARNEIFTVTVMGIAGEPATREYRISVATAAILPPVTDPQVTPPVLTPPAPVTPPGGGTVPPITIIAHPTPSPLIPTLPPTGVNTTPSVMLGVLLTVLGSALLLISRRRRDDAFQR